MYVWKNTALLKPKFFIKNTSSKTNKTYTLRYKQKMSILSSEIHNQRNSLQLILKTEENILRPEIEWNKLYLIVKSKKKTSIQPENK